MRAPQLGIVVGLADEADIARQFGGILRISGGTAAGAKQAVESCIASGARALLSFGYAGGLDPALKAGTLIVPETLIAGELRIETDLVLSRMDDQRGGTMVSTSWPVLSPAEKRKLFIETGAIAVDLESGPVARAAQAHKLPFGVLRAVCDPADRVVPPWAAHAISAKGKPRILHVLRHGIVNPGKLTRLAGDASAARRALTEYVAMLTKGRA